MGKKNGKKENKYQLIEFLYKDKNYIDSLYAQIFQGDLQKVSKNSQSKELTTNQLSGGIGLISGQVDSSSENAEEIQMEIHPHDSKILKLFEELEVNNCNVISESILNGLNKFHGRIEITDYDITKSQFDIMNRSGFMDMALGMANESNDDEDIFSIASEYNISKATFINEIIQLQPSGCDMVLTLSNKDIVLVPIIKEFLTMNVVDILRVYGHNIPGEWKIIGIFNSMGKSEYSNKIFSSITTFQKEITKSFSTQPSYVLKPIIIYRVLK